MSNLEEAVVKLRHALGVLLSSQNQKPDPITVEDARRTLDQTRDLDVARQEFPMANSIGLLDLVKRYGLQVNLSKSGGLWSAHLTNISGEVLTRAPVTGVGRTVHVAFRDLARCLCGQSVYIDPNTIKLSTVYSPSAEEVVGYVGLV